MWPTLCGPTTARSRSSALGKAQVLAVTRGNRYLVDTLRTPSAEEMADVVIATPDEARVDPLANDVKAGRFDLVIYDQVRPESPPAANTLYFGAIPPGKRLRRWKNAGSADHP